MVKLALLVAHLLTVSLALKVYENESSNKPNPDAGLRLIPKSSGDSNFTQGITICGRFKYQRLSKESTMFDIAAQQQDQRLVWSFMGYKETFIGFGDNHENWVVKNPPDNNFLIWASNRWHHVCLAYNRPTAHLLFVKVRELGDN